MDRYVEKQQLDRDGYRKNVGIIVCNSRQQVLWARRARHDGWQFPQGGIEPRESAREAAFRELYEEIGLGSADVKLLGSTDNWLRYDVPYAPKSRYYRRAKQFRGQKQRWFLMRFHGRDDQINIETEHPEFSEWTWIDPDELIAKIVPFKRDVYSKVMSEFRDLL